MHVIPGENSLALVLQAQDASTCRTVWLPYLRAENKEDIFSSPFLLPASPSIKPGFAVRGLTLLLLLAGPLPTRCPDSGGRANAGPAAAGMHVCPCIP